MRTIITKDPVFQQLATISIVLASLSCPTLALAEAGAKSMFSDEGTSVMMSDDDAAQPKTVAAKKSTGTVAKASASTVARASTSAPTSNGYAGVQYWVDLQEPNGRTRPVTTNHDFRSGDGIKLQIRSKTAGYLYVLNQDASGQVTPLYPAGGRPAELIQPNVTYTIPNRGVIRFDNVPGVEKVTIALAKYPVNQLIPGYSPDAPQAVQASYSNDSYSDCAGSGAGSKGMAVDEDGASGMDCIRNNHGAGSKGMMLEEDTSSAQPASYSMIPAASLDQGQVMFVDFTLNHR